MPDLSPAEHELMHKTLKYVVKAILIEYINDKHSFSNLTPEQIIEISLKIREKSEKRKENKKYSSYETMANLSDVVIGTLGILHIFRKGIVRKLIKAVFNSFPSVNLKSEVSISNALIYCTKVALNIGISLFGFPSLIITGLCFSSFSPCTRLFNWYKNQKVTADTSSSMQKITSHVPQIAQLNQDITNLTNLFKEHFSSPKLSSKDLQFIQKNYNLFFYESKTAYSLLQENNGKFIKVFQFFQKVNQSSNQVDNSIHALGKAHNETRLNKKLELESKSLANIVKQFIVSKVRAVINKPYLVPSRHQNLLSYQNRQEEKLRNTITSHLS